MTKGFEVTCNWCGIPEVDKVHVCSECGKEISEKACDKYQGVCLDCQDFE